MTKIDEAFDEGIPFGKYRGDNLGEVYAKDPDYVKWLIETVDRVKFRRLGEALDTIEERDG